MIRRYSVAVATSLTGNYNGNYYLDFGIGRRSDRIAGIEDMYPIERLFFQHDTTNLINKLKDTNLYREYGTSIVQLGTYYYKTYQKDGSLSQATLSIDWSVVCAYGGFPESLKPQWTIYLSSIKFYDENGVQRTGIGFGNSSIGGIYTNNLKGLIETEIQDGHTSFSSTYSGYGNFNAFFSYIDQTASIGTCVISTIEGHPYVANYVFDSYPLNASGQPVLSRSFHIFCYDDTNAPLENCRNYPTNCWYANSIRLDSTGAISGTSPSNYVNCANWIYYMFANGKEIRQDEPTYPEIEPTIGKGDYDNTSDDIDFPALPQGGLSGFFNVYELSLTQLQSFGVDIFNTEFDEALYYWSKNSTPMDYIIALKSMPTLTDIEQNSNIVVGNIEMQSQGRRITNRYYYVDCGSFNCKEYFGNFKDFANTKLSIYLPFVGIVSLNTQDVMSGKIYIRYYIDVVTGDAICFIKISRTKNGTALNSVLYNYKCNVSSDYPLTATNSNALLKGATALLDNSSLGFANSINNSAPHSMIGQSNIDIANIRYPYLIIEREISAQPKDYIEYEGIVYKNKVKLSDIEGYTQIEKIISPNISIPKAHLDLIEKALQNGVYL